MSPSPIVWIKRVSQVWPSPTLSQGKPIDWSPTSQVLEDWGRLQVVMDGTDVTFYRTAITQVESFSSTEPFSDEIATIFFPQLTPLDSLPPWIDNMNNVEIYLVRPNGSRKVLFEGFIAAVSDSMSSDAYGCRVECVGALYQLDYYLAKPPLAASKSRDTGHVIADMFTQAFAPGLRCGQMSKKTTGIMTNKQGGWDPALTGFVQEILSLATTDDHEQYTVTKNSGRIPVLKLKDYDTVHWTVRTGQPGVFHDLTKDYSSGYNVYYGEGIREDQCRWRNAIYPNIPISTPVFGGNVFTVGESDPDFLLFEEELFSKGYNFNRNGTYDSAEEVEVERFQAQAGIQIDGAVGPQTWAAAFEPGADGASFDDAYFFPLSWVGAAQPFHVGAHGQMPEPNPDYDPQYPHVERYENFGSDIGMNDGIRSASNRFSQFWPVSYYGTIDLEADPQEGSKFEIQAGENIQLLGHRGTARTLHIASAEHDVMAGKTSLVVDENARDFLVLSEVMQRNKENSEPSWKREIKYRNSKRTEDRVATWDCESGAGIIPYHATFNKLWNVLRIPCSAGGQIVRTEFTLDVPARFAVGIFDRPVTASQLIAHGEDYAQSPLLSHYWTGDEFFDQFGDGLLIAWGGEGQAAGYWPGSEGDDNELTGKLVDDSSWYFESQKPPWLWVCIWVESPTINYCRGRLFPGVF